MIKTITGHYAEAARLTAMADEGGETRHVADQANLIALASLHLNIAREAATLQDVGHLKLSDFDRGVYAERVNMLLTGSRR